MGRQRSRKTNRGGYFQAIKNSSKPRIAAELNRCTLGRSSFYRSARLGRLLVKIMVKSQDTRQGRGKICRSLPINWLQQIGDLSYRTTIQDTFEPMIGLLLNAPHATQQLHQTTTPADGRQAANHT